MTAARKLWTEDHQRQLKGARLEAGVSDVAFARDNAMTLRHLQQLEEGGSSAFYSESIKFDMGAKLLKRLGVEVIDLYYQHRVDPDTPIEETLRGLASGAFEIHYPKRFTRLMKLLTVLPYALSMRLLKRIKLT
mgnify:CR=1 FL=1